MLQPLIDGPLEELLRQNPQECQPEQLLTDRKGGNIFFHNTIYYILFQIYIITNILFPQQSLT